jgi:hypothetical protein
MRALAKLDASDNDMFGLKDKTGITAWAAALKACTSITELNLAKNGINANDTKILAPAISNMGAMTKFDISSNDIRAEGGKALAEGLKGNQVIKELNFSDSDLGSNSNLDTDTSGIIAVADVIPGMGALSSLTFSGETYFKDGLYVEDAVTITAAMTAADFSGKHLGSPGAIILGAWLSSDKGALTKIDLSRNNIPSDQEGRLQRICGAGGTELAI